MRKGDVGPIVLFMLLGVARSGAEGEWELLGPEEVFTINQVEALGEDYVYAIARRINPDTHDVIRTSYPNIAWEPLFIGRDDLPPFRIHNLLAQSLAVNFIATTDGVYRTGDGGQSWVLWGELPGPTFGLASDSAGRIYATGVSRVYVSEDLGVSWESHVVTLGETNITQIVIDSSGVLVCRSGAQVYRSTDDGQSWEGVFPVQGPERGWIDLEVSPLDHLFLLESGTFLGTTLAYRSADMGSTWEDLPPSPYSPHEIEISKRDCLLGLTAGQIIESLDNGTTWIERHSTLDNIMAQTLRTLHISESGRLFVGTPAGVFRSRFTLPGFNRALEWNSYP